MSLTTRHGTVSVISGLTNKVTVTISVGTEPDGVAVNPVNGTVYVANSTSDTVSVISGFTGTVTGTITVVNGPEGIAVSLVNGTVYVTNSVGTTVSVISGSLL